ncbi:MAG: hypothetical protein GF308_02105 [Candidatus Heimdallarchaeota archaeon]|nr:hypothetical protein [Candidatus Heimdallarchaeota archaeon]
MSYVEKSVYRYVLNILTSGIKALFTRKFIVYTIFFITVVVTTTVTAILETLNVPLFGLSAENLLNYVFYFELAFASSYILVGSFLAKLPQYVHVPLMVIVAGGLTAGFYFLDNIIFSSIFGFVLYCLWIMITIISAYSFSRNLFGGRVLGSILFMGKREGGPALFAGLMTPLALVFAGLDGYIFYQGIVLSSWLYMVVGIVGICVNLFLLYLIWGLARKDDVFYTIVPFFYLLANTHTVQMVIRLASGEVNYLSWASLVLMAFFLLNSVSKYYRKIKKLDLDFSGEEVTLSSTENDPQKKKKKRKKEEEELDDDEFFISNVFRFVTDSGVIMVILGFAMAYHAMALQIGFKRVSVLKNIGLTGGIVQTGHCVTLLFAAFIVLLSVAGYYLYARFREYSSPPIFRLSFLPPYEELESFFKKAKKGEINWGVFARDATVKVARRGIYATTNVSVSIKKQVVGVAKKGAEVIKDGTKTAYERARGWGDRFFRRRRKETKGQLKPKEKEEEENEQEG